MQELVHAEFQAFINDNNLVFVDFWAQWCAPCKQFSLVYDHVSGQFPEIQFAKVNIEEEKELAELFVIRSIPHLMVFKDGIVVYSDSGSISEAALKELAQQALDVDVSKVKS